MKTMIVGGDTAALVAAYAVWCRDPHAEMVVLAPGVSAGVLALFSPTTNEIVPSVAPYLTELAEVRTITTIPSGDPVDWPAKIGTRPNKVAEFFPDVSEPTTTYGQLASDIFDMLIQVVGPSIAAWAIDKVTISEMAERLTPDLIVNTAPRQIVCTDRDGHGFPRRSTWVSHKIGPDIDNDTILVNSEDAPGWYVSSRFDGHQVTRWAMKPPYSGVLEESFPISTNCDCAPHGMIHTGVEATCNPLATLVDVYSDTAAAMMALQGV